MAEIEEMIRIETVSTEIRRFIQSYSLEEMVYKVCLSHVARFLPVNTFIDVVYPDEWTKYQNILAAIVYVWI